jgi:hypothetical protein
MPEPRHRKWTDAFVDESVRGQKYVMACVFVDGRDLAVARRHVRSLLQPGQRRIHFHDERAGRRAMLLGSFASLPVRAVGFVVQRSHGTTEFHARAAALAALVEEAQRRGVERLVLESRQDDRDDVATIERARQPEPQLRFEFRAGGDDPLLWLADGITWAVAAGHEWSARIGPVLLGLRDIAP